MDKDILIYHSARYALHLLLKFWNRYEVTGKEHVPGNGGCLIAANHTSFLDPAAMSCGIPHRDTWFLARDSLFGGKPANFKRLHCIPLNRDAGEVSALRRTIEYLKNDEVVGLFPEGTRSDDGTLQPAKKGVGFIVQKAGKPVIPTLIRGAYEAYGNKAKWIRPKKIRVAYGKPITPEEITALGKGREAHQAISDLIMERIRALLPSQNPA